MQTRVGCLAIIVAGCAGCCCGRLPTFGLWPEVEPAAIRADLLSRPHVVQKLCRVDQVCSVVSDAEIEVVPVSWNPLTGTVVSLVAVEATCQPSTELAQALEPIACAGVLAAVASEAATGLLVHQYVCSDTWWGIDVDTSSPSSAGGGGDWDWD